MSKDKMIWIVWGILIAVALVAFGLSCLIEKMSSALLFVGYFLCGTGCGLGVRGLIEHSFASNDDEHTVVHRQ